MKDDKKLHIVCSAALTLVFGAPAAIAIGTVLEYWDYKSFGNNLKESAGDTIANVAGVAVGLLIKKIVK